MRQQFILLALISISILCVVVAKDDGKKTKSWKVVAYDEKNYAGTKAEISSEGCVKKGAAKCCHDVPDSIHEKISSMVITGKVTAYLGLGCTNSIKEYSGKVPDLSGTDHDNFIVAFGSN